MHIYTKKLSTLTNKIFFYKLKEDSKHIWYEYEHMRRKKENRTPKMAMQYKPTCKQKWKTKVFMVSWFDGIREAMKKRLTVKDWRLD